MEQSVALRPGFGEYAVCETKPTRTRAEHPSALKANADAFSAAWEEARLAWFGSEPKRAQYYFRQALEAAPEDVEPETLADILESLQEVNRMLACHQAELLSLRAEVAEEPDNSEKRFRYAGLLWRLGCEEEAASEYEAVLKHPESLCPECQAECWNNVGWSLYRKGAYARALPWFARAAKVKSVRQRGEAFQFRPALENMILTYVELNRRGPALKTAVDYISRYGRLPWPERRALRRLNIDADALFVQSCGEAA
jgi:tetratricopeptide (TPR) repeat protein